MYWRYVERCAGVKRILPRRPLGCRAINVSGALTLKELGTEQTLESHLVALPDWLEQRVFGRGVLHVRIEPLHLFSQGMHYRLPGPVTMTLIRQHD